VIAKHDTEKAFFDKRVFVYKPRNLYHNSEPVAIKKWQPFNP
jgi:hypothetical protein